MVISWRRSAGAFAGVFFATVLTVPGVATAAGPSGAHHPVPAPVKVPVATGYGGAVATVDADATRVGLDVLRAGGNAVDAAVAAAATLGVTEPFSSGIGGGGFFVYYDARTGRVHTLDGREAAPASMRQDTFVDPATGQPYAFSEARISGLSVGVPGTLLTWREALDRWGTRSLGAMLTPAAGVAERGFVVDATFASQISDIAAAFGQFSSTSELYLPGGTAPAVGSVQRNPDLAATYRLIARYGTDVFYRGAIGRDIVRTVAAPPLSSEPVGSWPYPVRPAELSPTDLSGYAVRAPAPTRTGYRGLEVYSMPAPSSGGTTVGEALNILERSELSGLDRTQALHRYLEASALAFADRNRYQGDGTPRELQDELLSDGFAAERACLIDPARALPKPVAPGLPDGSYSAPGACPVATAGAPVAPEQGTTNLTVVDRWGNIVEYTLTIESTGGNGMVVPGRGFLLNNELTDFNFTPTQGDAPDPNLPAPGKRPRSSMSPTIVLAHGRPVLALGSPGGATIITTVLQVLINRLDLGLTLPQALAAGRASQRNTAATQAEPALLADPVSTGLTALGHSLTPVAEIGAATAIELLAHGRLLAVAEPVRRGGGAAAVVTPAKPG